MVYEFKRLSGFFVLVFAFFCSLHISDHLHSQDAYFHAFGYADVGITAALVAAGLYLLLSPTGTPPMVPRKPQKPTILAVFGIFLIWTVLHNGSSQVLISLTESKATGTVITSVPGKALRSGKVKYSVYYQYTDSAGAAHTATDAVYSVTPINSPGQVDIAYSSVKPAISLMAGNVNYYWGWSLGLGLLYEYWAVRGVMRKRRLARKSQGRPKLQPLAEVIVTAGIVSPFLALLIALSGAWLLYGQFSQHHLGDIDWGFSAMVAVFVLLGIVGIIFSLSIRITISDQGILSQRLFREDKRVTWDQITSVSWGRYRKKAKGFHINTLTGVELHIPAYFQNLEGLVSSITAHLQPSVYTDAHEGFAYASKMARLGRRHPVQATIEA
jgi:hypothetical protein